MCNHIAACVVCPNPGLAGYLVVLPGQLVFLVVGVTAGICAVADRGDVAIIIVGIRITSAQTSGISNVCYLARGLTVYCTICIGRCEQISGGGIVIDGLTAQPARAECANYVLASIAFGEQKAGCRIISSSF